MRTDEPREVFLKELVTSVVDATQIFTKPVTFILWMLQYKKLDSTIVHPEYYIYKTCDFWMLKYKRIRLVHP